MTDISVSTITSPETFRNALATVIAAATARDVDVRGAWEFRSPELATDWEVTVTKLAPRPDEGAGDED